MNKFHKTFSVDPQKASDGFIKITEIILEEELEIDLEVKENGKWI